ncbi:MAG: hypothetical protein IJ151_04005 [Bacteroidales bacterium]|nr:hypothetical protein [Bacteroidales bacterium]
MKKNILLIAALAGAMFFTACQKAEEEFVEEKPEVTEQETVTYSLTIRAERNDGPETKGLDIDGEEATSTLLKSIWKAGEPVKVYLGTECIGTLTATPDGADAHKATLSGTVTTTGVVANSTRLTLLTPREAWDYTGQVGKLLLTDDAENSIEKKYHYTAATNVLVTAVSGSNITTEEARFANQQSIYRLSFRYDNGGSKTAITTKSVTISAANGHLVQSQAVDGSSLVEGPVSVTLGTASANPFFVALRNTDETNTESLSFTVIDADGVTYKGSKTIPTEYKPNGTFVSIKNATLDQRLQLAQSATEVDTVL